jgi:hypothetical protein
MSDKKKEEEDDESWEKLPERKFRYTNSADLKDVFDAKHE